MVDKCGILCLSVHQLVQDTSLVLPSSTKHQHSSFNTLRILLTKHIPDKIINRLPLDSPHIQICLIHDPSYHLIRGLVPQHPDAGLGVLLPVEVHIEHKLHPRRRHEGNKRLPDLCAIIHSSIHMCEGDIVHDGAIFQGHLLHPGYHRRAQVTLDALRADDLLDEVAHLGCQVGDLGLWVRGLGAVGRKGLQLY